MADTARRRVVTEKPLRIEPTLLGAPLASFRRRAVAYVLDNLLLGSGGRVVNWGLFFPLSRWDPNRQADHDKIVHTVVVRERR